MWPFLNQTTTCGCSADPCTKIPSNNIQYQGPNLICSGINNLDNLTTVIQKLEQKVCDLTSNYTVYRAILSQTDNNLPVITILENNLGGTPTCTVTGTGTFQLELTGKFIPNKTHILQSSSVNKFISINNTDSNIIDFTVTDNTNNLSPGFTKMSLEIKVYN